MSAKPALAIVPPSSPDGTGAIRGRLLIFFRQHGHEFAVTSGTLEIRPDDLPPLHDFAESMVRSAVRKRFDPSGQVGDQLRSDAFERSRTRLKQTDDAIRNAVSSARGCSERSARAASLVPPRPEKPTVAMVMAVCVLTITIAPTLHDFVFLTLADDILSWFLSLAFSSTIGVMLTWGLVVRAASPAASRAAMAAGILLGLGLAMLRLSAARIFAEVLFAIGLTVIEVGAVVFLDWLSANHQSATGAWQKARTEADEQAAFLATQREEVRRLESERDKIAAEMTSHTNYVEEREELSGDLCELVQASIEAISNGYRAGVAENQGRVQRFQ